MLCREVTDDIRTPRTAEHTEDSAGTGGLFTPVVGVGGQTNAIQDSNGHSDWRNTDINSLQTKSVQDFCRRFGCHYEYFGAPRLASMNNVNYIPYYEKLTKALKEAGNLYTLQDILAAIAEDRMQSFAEGNTWAITEVHTFPGKKVLDICYVVGDMKDAEKLHDRVIEFAKSIDASMVRAFGRHGWEKHADKNGWRMTGQTYHKDI
jgi:hypothetical protein